MRVPSEAELAAIAAAYVAVTARADAPVPPEPELSRWRLAGRLPDSAAENVRSATSSASRWNAAGRLDD